MKRSKFIQLMLFSIVVFGFGIEPQNKPKHISEFKQTDFLPTLEHTLKYERNSIYSSSFLYTWEEFKRGSKSPIKIDTALHDLCLINNSTSHLNTLLKGEYTSISNVQGSIIRLKSSFQKTLPFIENGLFHGHNELVFMGRHVSSFGTYGDQSKIIKILYYNDDDNFIISLLPIDGSHEIVLYTSEEKLGTMKEIISDIESKIKIGQQEQTNALHQWKYILTEYDIIDIPVIGFNIEANYSTIEGNRFNTVNGSFTIGSAWQRTAFYLNEKGAELDSNGETQIVFSEPVIADQVTPKIMRFDKPFFIMLKRTDAVNPYFGLWIANQELMTGY